MRKKVLLSLALGLGLSLGATAGDYVVRVPLVTYEAIYDLPQPGVQVWQDLGSCAIARVSPDGLKGLEAQGFRPEVLGEVKTEGAYYVAYLGRPEGQVALDRWAKVLCVVQGAYLIWVQDPEAFVSNKGPLMLARIGTHPVVLAKPPGGQKFTVVPRNPFVQDMVNSVRVDSVMAALRRLQNYRNRSSSSDSCRAAVTWTRDKYRAYRNRIPQDSAMFQTWSATYAPNVILERPGYTHPESICVIGGHIDDVSNPGADDNATGTVAAIEAARVMKPYLFERTVRFCAFTGEEQGLLGSDTLAGLYRQRGDNILGMLNYDMIGHVNPSPETLEIIGRTGGEDAWLMSFVKSAADTYVTSPPLLIYTRNQSLSGSDHASFWAQGYTATCGIEDYPLQNPAYHTQADSIGTGPNVGVNDSLWFVNVVRSAVAAFALLAQPLAPYAQFRLQAVAADTIGPSASTVDSVTVSSMASFNSPVTMTLDSIRPATGTITVAFNPNPVTPPPNGSIKTGMEITTNATPQNNYVLYYHGTGDTVTRREQLALWVTAPTFVIQSTPRSQSVFLGDSVNYADTLVSISGYANPCTLSATVNPPAPSITVSFLPDNVVIPTGGRTMRVRTTAQTTPGTYLVTITARNGGTVKTLDDTLVVKYPVQGPDPYGYYAYDNTDQIFENAPTYGWIELNPSRGGNGTSVGISGDDMTLRKLAGIRARHYGTRGDSISICTNAWAAIGRTTLQVYSNQQLPSTSFVPNGIAAFWDDLTISGTGTCWYRVDANQRFIAEWDSVPTLGGQYAGTFEIIVYDTSLTPLTARTRDSEIIIQWKNVGSMGSMTVGQQNTAMAVGLNSYYNGTYDPQMAPITAGRATKYTTDPPRLRSGVDLNPLVTPALPVRFALGPAVPNPSRGYLAISYDLPVETQVSLKVYNLSGQLVRTLAFGKEKAGCKHAAWDGRSESGARVASGVYFYRLEAGSFAATKKMVVIR